MSDNQDVERSESQAGSAAGPFRVELIVVRTLLVLVGAGLATFVLIAIWP